MVGQAGWGGGPPLRSVVGLRFSTLSMATGLVRGAGPRGEPLVNSRQGLGIQRHLDPVPGPPLLGQY